MLVWKHFKNGESVQIWNNLCCISTDRINSSRFWWRGLLLGDGMTWLDWLAWSLEAVWLGYMHPGPWRRCKLLSLRSCFLEIHWTLIYLFFLMLSVTDRSCWFNDLSFHWLFCCFLLYDFVQYYFTSVTVNSCDCLSGCVHHHWRPTQSLIELSWLPFVPCYFFLLDIEIRA